ncbi:MAG: hypothetical protein Q7R87_02945 [Nanoarchaeota archaeon]|nr:hypothetical protein [Nanoarchaeota archaeon]
MRLIEVYDTFEPSRLLEFKCVPCDDLNGEYITGYDESKSIKDGRKVFGFTLTGRTFRSSYGSMREHFEGGKSALGFGERVNYKR